MVFYRINLFCYILNQITSGYEINENNIYNCNIGKCTINTVNSLLKFGKENQYSNKVPKIIHYVYKTNYIPNQYSQYIKQCMAINKDSKFVFWSDFSTYRLIIHNFPQYKTIYQTYLNKNIYSLKISDVNRYFILFKFGGIYMDLDTKCQKPFELAMMKEACILSKEVEEQTRILWDYKFALMNSLMACVPYHNFFSYLIDKLTMADMSSVLEQTGPFMLTRLFIEFTKSVKNNSNIFDNITAASPFLFSPLIDQLLEIRCNGRERGKWREKGCKTLPLYRRIQHSKEKEAIAVHMFLHLGYTDRKHLIVKMDHICRNFENISIPVFY